MIDIKKVKKALLQAFNTAELPPERIAQADTLDDMLNQYFNRASHMPKELTFEAILNVLKSAKTDQDVSHKRVKEILDQFH